MRVNALRLTDFQSWREEAIEFTKPVAFVLGQNNAGKTSLARGLEIVLRGSPSLTKQKNLVVADMIRDGCKVAKVEGDIQNGDKAVVVRRTIKAAGIETHINGSPVSKKVFDFYTPDWLLDPDGVYAVLCNVSGFFDLTLDKQKAILEDLVDQSVPEALMAGLTLTPYLPGMPKTLYDVEDAYNLVFAMRRTAKIDANAGITVQDPGPVPDIAAIDAKLNGLRDEERKLIAKVGERAGERKAISNQVARYDARVLQAETELLGLGTREAAVKAAADAVKFSADTRAAAAATSTGTERLRRIKTAEAKLFGIKGKCVISDGDLKVPCPLNAETKSLIGDAWAKEREKIEAAVGGAVTPKEVAAAENAERAATKRVEDIDSKAKELDTLKANRASLIEDLDKCPADADTASLAELRGRIQKGESNLAQAKATEAQKKKHTEQVAARDSQHKRLADLEALVKAFGPKGIRERLLTERVGAVLTALNAHLKGFGMEAGLSSDPWGVRLNGRHPELASASERFRAGVAFQIALAELTGVRLVVIDAVDILDKLNRATLFGLLGDAVSDGKLDQAVILATSQEEPKLRRDFPPYIQPLIVRRGLDGYSEVTT